jgi:hypothetical protein
LQLLDPSGLRIAQVLRETIDQLLDGQRTGRWNYTDLLKTEKTHMGTLVEINLQREFDFGDGGLMDYRIAGVEVDCKFSKELGGWQIPLEADGHLCLLVWADDQLSLWSAGLIRVTDAVLRRGRNRDSKRTLNKEGVRQIAWLWHRSDLPVNLLLHLDEESRSRIFSFPGKGNGQRRTDELFRLVPRRLVSRTTVLTVAQQSDAPKRVRDSRKNLRSAGFVILGHQGDHPRVARALGLPAPSKGEWVSARLVRCGSTAESPRVSIVGVPYRLARLNDPIAPAPALSASSQATT